jgi:hypothetical protein
MRYYSRYLTIFPIFLFAFFFLPEKGQNIHNTTAPAIKDSLFDLCAAMPGDEVAALSPFGKLIKLVTPQERLDGFCGCHYDLQSEDDYPQVQIGINQFSSAKESKQNYVIMKEGWVNLYQRQPEYIPNLGDSANFQGNADPGLCDDCGLQVASGRYYITVAIKGYYDKISAAAKRDAAIRIVQTIFRKKPYLNSRRQN